MMTYKVKNYLEKALAADPSYSPAVYLLAEHYDQEQRYEDEFALLKKHVDIIPTARTHQLLGEYELNIS